MRFAWLKKNKEQPTGTAPRKNQRLMWIKSVYNIIFWIFLLPFIFSSITYNLGFIAFSIVILVRLLLNLYTNNIYRPTVEQFERYPFRT